jgi:hypothetical protein
VKDINAARLHLDDRDVMHEIALCIGLVRVRHALVVGYLAEIVAQLRWVFAYCRKGLCKQHGAVVIGGPIRIAVNAELVLVTLQVVAALIGPVERRVRHTPDVDEVRRIEQLRGGRHEARRRCDQRLLDTERFHLMQQERAVLRVHESNETIRALVLQTENLRRHVLVTLAIRFLADDIDAFRR